MIRPFIPYGGISNEVVFENLQENLQETNTYGHHF